MSRRRRRKAYNAFFIFFTLIIVCAAAVLTIYVLHENNYFKEYWPKTWKHSKQKISQETKKDDEEINYDDQSFYSIYEHVSDYTSLRSISGFNDFSATELLGIVKEDFVTSDFQETEEVSSNDLKVYTLDGSILSNYLQNIFGKVTIDLSSFENCSAIVSGTTGASLGGSGMTLISFDKDSNTFKVTFAGVGGSTSGLATIIDRKVVSAIKKKKEIVVQDKIIYPSLEINNNRTSFTYKIYADPNHSDQLDSVSYTADNVSIGVIDVEEYLERTSTIEYHFQFTDGKYYFKSSTIKKG